VEWYVSTEVSDLNTARYKPRGIGVSNTSGLAVGGNTSTPVFIGNTESWNGTSWTEVNDLNTVRSMGGTNGTITSGLYYGGSVGGTTFYNNTESWNGTSWTEVNDLNVTRRKLGGAGVDNTSALAFGGYTNTPGTPDTIRDSAESWNGASWVNESNLNQGREAVFNAGTISSALAAGGNTPTITAATEEWNNPSNVIQTITTS